MGQRSFGFRFFLMVACVLAVAAVVTAIVFLGYKTPYCESEFMYQDMDLVGSMNTCMATVGCSFPRSDIGLYRAAGERLNMCLEQLELEQIPEPDQLPERD